MKMTIRTHFKGATDTQGARIIAKGMGRQKSISYPYELTGSECHKLAAMAFIETHFSRNGWDDMSNCSYNVIQSHKTGYTFEVTR